MKTRSVLILVAALSLLLLFSSSALAEGVIGRDTYFSLKTASILITDDENMSPYVQVFNYFFTIELFFGLVAVFLKQVIRVFRMQQMDIAGKVAGGQAVITLNGCPIGSVCRNRGHELGGEACTMFHYYFAGIMAELVGRPARPKTVEIGDTCRFNIQFSGAPARTV